MPRTISSHGSSAANRKRKSRQPAKSQASPRDVVDLSAAARNGNAATVDESQERALLKNFGRGGGLVKIADGSKRSKTLTIHGINGAPDSVQELSDASAKKGKDVFTYVYDDRHTRLGTSSDGLAAAIQKLQQDGQPLTIRAHSMGGRLAVDALRKLSKSGVVKGKIALEMTNPVIGGLGSANSARYAPPIIDGMIPGVKPGKDMGTNSKFQSTLETTKLPPNVTTTTFVGDKDHLVDADDPHFKAVHDGLNGRVHVVKNGGHDNTIGAVARRK